MKSVHTQAKSPAEWVPITTAVQLLSADLDFHDLGEAFGMLSRRQQEKYLALCADSTMAYDPDYDN